ncbi:type II toxin-antitoxin system RelE/ParE family toxin [Sphingomonas sp.]|uniref:type II toxin-antitoxin system RelE/ParE family toxin n=1 Tax=Sphingomonas sp. TaxID=28214 RepID=UPI0026386324|nr:type II toxin-antitoxin system RelE/ParE family toxin [Sphingomonas sp.]MDF2496147.1 plasmid stabilization system family protein [Sphingomonas sp.]
MAEYRFSPAAQRDLGEVFDYSVATWGLAQALDYTDLIAAVCAELAQSPQGVGQHMIYFRPTDYGIAVIRILHQRMDAGRHL